MRPLPNETSDVTVDNEPELATPNVMLTQESEEGADCVESGPRKNFSVSSLPG